MAKRPNTLKPGTNYYDFFWEAQNLETLMIPREPVKSRYTKNYFH
ncbi:hypothetical protein BH11BAC3_BH11BAC3_34010 [soil metagenome]